MLQFSKTPKIEKSLKYNGGNDGEHPDFDIKHSIEYFMIITFPKKFLISNINCA